MSQLTLHIYPLTVITGDEEVHEDPLQLQKSLKY